MQDAQSAAPGSDSFTSFMSARRAQMAAALVADHEHLSLYGTEEYLRSVMDQSISVQLANMAEPEVFEEWVVNRIELGNRRREAAGAPGAQLDQVIGVLNGMRREYLKRGLEAVTSGVPDAVAGLQTLLSMTDRVLTRLARIYSDAGRAQSDQLRVFKLMADRSIDGITLVNRDDILTYINLAGARIFGLTPDQMIGTKSGSFADPDDVARHVDEMRAAFRASGAWRGKLWVLHAPSGKRLIETLAFILPDVEGRPDGRASIYRDITQAEADEEQRLALLEERNTLQDQVIEAQQRALRELSVPLIPLSRGLLLVPLIGRIDALRAAQIMETSLQGINLYKASRLILDITGVSAADAQVVDALIRTARAARLLGVQVALTGVQPSIARAFVELGADLGDVITYRTIQEGIARSAERLAARAS